MPNHDFVLTLSCPDRPGIVAAVSTFLFDRGQNIIDAQQFDDAESGNFFMRVVFSATDAPVPLPELREGFGPIAERFAMNWKMRDRETLKATCTTEDKDLVAAAASQLAGFLARRKPRLTEAAVTALLVTAGLHGSWSAHVLDETLRHETRFARLKAEVDAAARRRMAWIVGGAAGVTALVAAAAVLG